MAIYNYLENTGVIVPDTSEVLSGVQVEFTSVFGADLVTTINTPQGLLIAGETAARSAVIANNAALANQINPNLAGGVSLDAIGALTGLERGIQKFSSVLINLAGVANTIIPAGVTMQSDNGDIFASTNTVTLNLSGVASVLFQAVKPGPLTVAIGGLTQIVKGVLGWETGTNPSAAIPGSLTQSDIAFRNLRRQTLALQGNGFAEAIISALLITPGVLNLKFRENTTATTQTIDGVTMTAHSLYVCVSGGTDLAVATTLVETKEGGCGYNNGPGINISQNVIEPASGQTFNVLFDRPNLIPVLIKITVTSGQAGVNPTTSVQQAILDYANGLLDGEPGFVVGGSVSSFELAGAVSQEVPGIYVHVVQTTKASSISYSSNEIAINIYEQATIQLSSIQVTLA